MMPSAKFWIIGFRQPYSEEIVVMWFLCQIFSEDVIMMRSLLANNPILWRSWHLFRWDDLFVKLDVEDGDVFFNCLWYPGGISKGTPRLPRKITCRWFIIFRLHFGAKSSCLKKITINVWGMVHLVQTASKVAQIARGAYVAAPRLVGETTGLRKMVVINCSMICLSIPSTYAKCWH